MTDSYVEVIQQLADTIPSLAPQQRIAAQYFIDHPDEIGLRSMRDIAIEANIQPATISRLCRSMGFDSYKEFTAPFKQQLRKSKGNYLSRLKAVQSRGDQDIFSLYKEVRDQDIQNIKNTLTDDKFPALVEAVETLYQSRRVYVIGLRGSYSPAFLFHYAYQLFRDNSQLLDTNAGMLADQLRGISSADCMLVTSFDPYTKMTIDAVEFAIAAGVKIIAITDKYTSPIAKAAAHTILVQNNSPSIYQSLNGVLSVNHALITLLVSRSGENAVEIIQEAEKQLSSISAYW
jgi:DNA-binding MurR/RpiR family transcriptional regulator